MDSDREGSDLDLGLSNEKRFVWLALFESLSQVLFIQVFINILNEKH